MLANENLSKIEESLEVKQAVSGLNDFVFVTHRETEVEAQHNDIVYFNIANSFKTELVSHNEAPEVSSEVNLDLIVSEIATAMNHVANLQFKGSTFIEPNEIEYVKNTVLNNREVDAEKRAALENELNKFENQIKENYRASINEYNSKRIKCDQMVDMLSKAKSELVAKRISQMQWPYNETTKAYDNKIAALKVQSVRFAQKVIDLEAMRPAAKEKDILVFQMQLKEKFAV